MQADVDNYLTLAGEKNYILYLVKANTFRKTVWKKENSVKDIDQAIVKLEYELKNQK